MTCTFLDSVKLETENMEFGPNTIQPPNEVGEKDHVVGDADPEIRKLYALAMQWDKAAVEMLVAARYVNDNATREQSMRDAAKLHEKSGILMNIFWVSLKDAYDLWERPSIGIRKGWKVVWTEHDPMPTLGDILGGIFER